MLVPPARQIFNAAGARVFDAPTPFFEAAAAPVFDASSASFCGATSRPVS
jgi:hypothetical protein